MIDLEPHCETCTGMQREICDIRFEFRADMQASLAKLSGAMIDAVKEVAEKAYAPELGAQTQEDMLDMMSRVFAESSFYDNTEKIGCTLTREEIDQKVTMRVGTL